LWVGGKEFNNRWQWDVNIRKDIVVADWSNNEPNDADSIQSCLGLFDKSHGQLLWVDVDCTISMWFVCEKSLR